MALTLVVVLVDCCVSGTIVLCCAGCVSCCSCVSVKKRSQKLCVQVMLTLKVENMRNIEEGRK